MAAPLPSYAVTDNCAESAATIWGDGASTKTAEARCAYPEEAAAKAVARRTRMRILAEYLIHRREVSDGGLRHVFKEAPRRSVGDALGPIDSQRGIDGGCDILHEDGALLAPSGIDD